MNMTLAPHPNANHHPCFNKKAQHKYARVHLPVAPACNIQCRFCNRRYSCMNENRPGVTCTVLKPWQALNYLDKILEKVPNTSVVGIAGPGDAFANSKQTMETIRLVREKYPHLIFCLATNGLGIGPYIDQLAGLGVTHVTITINAADEKIGAKVYKWARDGNKVYRNEDAAKILLDRQLEAVERLHQKGIVVKINSILIPGVNDEHIVDIAQTVAAKGADIFNIMPIYPVAGTEFENVTPPSFVMLTEKRFLATEYIPQMTHCGRCRADAAGLLKEEMKTDILECLEESANMLTPNQKPKKYVAVVSSDGYSVNEHLGQASFIRIFDYHEECFDLVDVRKMPAPGTGDNRWHSLVSMLEDCKAIVVGSIGKKPYDYLSEAGVKVYQSENSVVDVLTDIFEGVEPENEERYQPTGCPGPSNFGFENGCASSSSCSSDCGLGGC